MHLGNIFTAVISYLSVRSKGGRWILRIEDLDPQRSKPEHAAMIEDDLAWLGLEWDEGGIAGKGDNGPYLQSLSGSLYLQALDTLRRQGFVYPCFCRRADLMASNAPHQSDGRIIYPGTCRPASIPFHYTEPELPHSTRLCVSDRTLSFTDRVFGYQQSNLAHDCGDFIIRRADGAWGYQLAVVVDDARMKVSEVVRGSDLLLSTAQQLYLYRLLGLEAPRFAHVPLICNNLGKRLSKRDSSLSMNVLRQDYTPQQLLGIIAHLAGLIPDNRSIDLSELITRFSWQKIPPVSAINLPATIVKTVP